MTTPVPIKAISEAAARLFADVKNEEIPPASPAARAIMWQRIDERLHGKEMGWGMRHWQLGWAGALMVAAILTAQLWLSHRGHNQAVASSRDAVVHQATPQAERRIMELAGIATLDLSTDAVVRVPDEPALKSGGPLQVKLDQGVLSAHVLPRSFDAPFTVATPQVKVVVVGTRFSVTVGGKVSVVAVSEGRVRVEAPNERFVLLGPGEAIRSDNSILQAPPVPVAPVINVDASCAPSLPLAARRDCLGRIAQGNDLAAGNALYSLGLLECNQAHDCPQAVGYWRQYEERFPDGALAAEVAFALVAELAQEKDATAAQAVVASYRRRFPSDNHTIQMLERRLASQDRR